MPDLDAMMQYWLDLLGVTPANGWRVRWGWVDEIPHPEGGNAVGLNTCDGDARAASIAIRRPRSARELADLDDTVAHEVVHCLGVRMQALLDAGRETEAHEYLAETLAPAMVRIKGTPRAKALAKAARKLPGVSLAKGTRMDVKAILAMLAMVMAASTPEEKEKLLGELKAQLEGQAGSDAAPASEVAPPLAAEPPKPPEASPPAAKPADGTSMGMSDEEQMMKSPMFKKVMSDAVDAILDARPELTAEQKVFAKSLGTPDKARAYLKTLPAATKPEAKPEPTTLGLNAKPQGGNGGPAAAKPSGDKKLNSLFRILPDDEGGDGVEHPDRMSTGVLLTHSVVGAYKTIKKNTAAMVATQKAKMLGGAA